MNRFFTFLLLFSFLSSFTSDNKVDLILQFYNCRKNDFETWSHNAKIYKGEKLIAEKLKMNSDKGFSAFTVTSLIEDFYKITDEKSTRTGKLMVD